MFTLRSWHNNSDIKKPSYLYINTKTWEAYTQVFSINYLQTLTHSGMETISGGFWYEKGTYLYNIQLRAKRDHNSKTYQTSLVWMTVFYQANKHFSSCRARWWTTWWRGSAPCSRWAASSTTRGTALVCHQVSGNFNIILIETHLSSRESTTAVKYNIQLLDNISN